MLGMSRVILLGEDRFQQGKMEALNEVVNVDYSQTICLTSYQTESIKEICKTQTP